MRTQRRTHMCAQQGKSARTEGHGGVSTGAQQGKSARMAVCMRQSMRLVVGGVRGRRGFRVLCPYEMCARTRGISEMEIGISEMKMSIVAVFSLRSTTLGCRLAGHPLNYLCNIVTGKSPQV